LKAADRLGARSTIVIGEDEVARGTVQVRDMLTGGQSEMGHDEAIGFLARNRAESGD